MADRDHSRFTDNPFRDPNIDPETAKRLDARNAAYSHWHETGDPGPINEFGFNLPDRRGLIITESTTVEALIAAHHDGHPIKFPKGDDTAGLYCPGCGQWMDGDQIIN